VRQKKLKNEKLKKDKIDIKDITRNSWTSFEVKKENCKVTSAVYF